MARLGAFDATLEPKAWFDSKALPEGWFDDELIPEPGAGGGVTGTGNITFGALTVAGAGTVGPAPITGTGNITLNALTATGAGTVGPEPITGVGNITLGALTVTGTGTVGGGVTGVGNITLGALTVAGLGTVGPVPPPPLVTGGGDDAPARTEDIRRLAKREKRRQRLEEERAARFRQALQAAYEAAEGLAETEAPSARVDVQEALADARKAAPETLRADIVALDRQARDLATIDRISALLAGIADLQARALADDDDVTILLMVM
jgi:hypothetical protein